MTNERLRFSVLASDVELLILDEPTSGLDPLIEATFRACIAKEKARGRTVLLSSHILAEVEVLCDRVRIVRNGRTVESGTLADLRHLTRTEVSAEVTAVPPALTTLESIHHLDIQGNSVRFAVDPNALGYALSLLTNVGLHSLT